MSKARIRKVITPVHMGLGHDGLKKLLAKPLDKGGAGLDVESLVPGELIMCINGAGNKLKVIGHHGLVIGYLKMPHKKRIMMEALQYIPQTFGGQGFDYNEACRKSLEMRMGRMGCMGCNKPNSGPLNAARTAKAAGL